MKKIISFIMTILVTCTMLPMLAVPAFAQTEDVISFYRWNESGHYLELDTHDGCVVADDNLKDIGRGFAEWVIVKDRIEIDKLSVHGEANLILADGGELVTEEIYGVGYSSLLHIYSESEDGKGGTLRVTGGDYIGIDVDNIDLCGGSLFVDEGYTWGVVNDVDVHGGFLSVMSEDICITGNLSLTGGTVKISKNYNLCASVGLKGNLFMDGGSLNIIASYYGIEGTASVFGGSLDIVAGNMGITELFTFDENIKSVHIAVNTRELPHTGYDHDIAGVSACYDIAGKHDKVLYFKGVNGKWELLGSFGDLGQNTLHGTPEILLLPLGSENPNFSPLYASSTISEGNIWIVVVVGAIVIIAVAVLIIVKKKKKAALVSDTENINEE